MVYEDVVGGKSAMWKYFKYDKTIQKAKCNQCGSTVSAKGQSSSGLWKHLSGVHKMETKDMKDEDSTTATPKKRKMESMDSYVTGAKRKKSLQEVIGHLCAVDLLSFRVISTSTVIRQAFKSDGYKLPECHRTVQRYMMQFYEQIKSQIKIEISCMIQEGKRLSASLDEYTSTRNRRYLNINLHYKGGFYSLGLVRAHGSMPANVMAKAVKDRLEDFGVDYQLVLAAITDGAPVMGSFSCKIEMNQVICAAHTIQKAIDDVLYPKKEKSKPEELDLDENSDDEEEEDENGTVQADVTLEDDQDLEPNYLSLIEKIRKICRLFRKSPVKNDDFLQPEVMKQLNKEVKVILDCKTRWYSMMDMVKRFLAIHKPIKQAMLLMDKGFDFDPNDLQDLTDLCNALEPLKKASLKLCDRDATLWSSERIMDFTLSELESQDTNIAWQLHNALKARIRERRNHGLIHLMEYLNNPKYVEKEKKKRDKKDQYGISINRNDVQDLAAELICKLYSVKEEEEDNTDEGELVIVASGSGEVASGSGSGVSCKNNTNLSIEERMNMHIQMSKNALPEASDEPDDIGQKLVEKEFKIFESTGGKERPKYLQYLHDALTAIPPTSVEPERSFSATGLFSTKLRSSLGDNSLNALLFLRQYFKREKQE